MPDPSVPMQCRPKKKCPNPTADICNCWKPDCSAWIHGKCSGMLLARHSAPVTERPTESDLSESDEPTLFCTKGCHTEWRSHEQKKERAVIAAAKAATVKKRKVPWEEDGSMTVLVDWLTTEGNHANHCGGSGGKGTSEAQHQKATSLLIEETKPDSDGRTEKDVENKIASLERQFRLAVDWADTTSQGVDKPGDFEAAVLNRCPCFKQSEDTMGDRPNAKPLALNEPDVLGIDSDDAESVGDPDAVKEMNNNPVATPPAASKSIGESVSTLSTKASALTAAPKGVGKRTKTSANSALLQHLESTDMENLREREVQAREKEASARMTEAVAMQEKAGKETSILGTEEKAKLLQARKKLLDEGTCAQEELDLSLPLPTK